MMIIDIKTTDVESYDDFQFCTDASQLGLKPGEWPDAIVCDCFMPYRVYEYLETQIAKSGDIISKAYVAKSGALITIFND